MERVAIPKKFFLLALLLVIASDFNGKAEAHREEVSDCVGVCGKCTAVGSEEEGICSCKCNSVTLGLGGIKQQKPAPCKSLPDCISVCASQNCKPVECKGGDCYCQCPKATLEGGIKQQKPAPCTSLTDCISVCTSQNCNPLECKGGVCYCQCPKATLEGVVGVQCKKPADCVGRCHGCLENKCTAGLCVCGC